MLEIVRQRLHNQYLSRPRFEQPEDVVRWMGAVQSQDHAAAKWAVALRTNSLKEADIEQAVTDGRIIRIHVMRPTWHYVVPADLRWMLMLTAPRVKVAIRSWMRQVEIDEALATRSNDLMAKALQGGKQLTRAELVAVLEADGIDASHLRAGFFTIIAELDGVICSGGYRGKWATYALLEERVPTANVLTYDEALAELTRRYFTSHGPATLKDYVWWSGLTMAQARAGIEMVKAQLASEAVEGQTYWFSPVELPIERADPTAYLLTNFDEYTVGYSNRSAVFDSQYKDKLNVRGDLVSSNTIALDGRIAASWSRTIKKGTALVNVELFEPLNEAQEAAVAAAFERYSSYLGLPVVIS